MLNATTVDPQQTIAELQRQLDERTAERDEALEQQTATAEVLQVINSSRGDLAPVFDAMLERAMRLCKAAHGHFLIYDGEAFRPTVARGEPRFAEYWRQQPPFRPAETNPLGRLVRGERVVHRDDAWKDDAYRDVPGISARNRFGPNSHFADCGAA
jgi:two-component system, NtrC family, sensor kinase